MQSSNNQRSSKRRVAKPAKCSTKLASYAVAATGAAVGLGGANLAEAGIIYSGPKNQEVAPNAIFTFSFVESDSSTQFSFFHFKYYDGESAANFGRSGIASTGFLLRDPYVRDLGAVFGGNDNDQGSIAQGFNFVDGYAGERDDADNLDKFLGVRFKNPANSDQFLYGWVSFSIVVDDIGSFTQFTINDWAYENSGAAISAGAGRSAIPEPTGLAMVALGGLAMASRRWRRVGQKTAA